MAALLALMACLAGLPAPAMARAAQVAPLKPAAADRAPPEDGVDAAAADTAEDGAEESAESDSAGSDTAGEAVAEAAEEAAPRPILWMETYTEGAYSKHEEDNASGFTDVKMGRRFDLGPLLGAPMDLSADVYLKARAHRDQRDFFWNNHLDAGAGARINLVKGAALSVYAEVLGGYYYRTEASLGDLSGLQVRIDRNRQALDALQESFGAENIAIFRRAALGDTVFTQKSLDSLDLALTRINQSMSGLQVYLDSLETTRDSLRQLADSVALVPAGPLTEYRAGFMFWYGRGQETPEGGRRLDFPLRFWCDLYADGTFSSLSRHVLTRGSGDAYRDSVARFTNFILYLNPDVGVILLNGEGGSMVAYGTAYAWLDTHGDWWNNRAMAGPGLRHKPFKEIDLTFAAEYLWGAYYGRERAEDPNPYKQSFQDMRLMVSFWYGLGF